VNFDAQLTLASGSDWPSNGGPPLDEEVIVIGNKMIKTIRVGGAVVSIIVKDVFFPDPAGESEETIRNLSNRGLRGTKVDHSDEFRRLKGAQDAQRFRDRSQNPPGFWTNLMRLFHQLF
jgi:hypothetical protein